MNRKNRKEKEQNTDVSKQICVHKTQNTLLEFNSFLRMAEPKDEEIFTLFARTSAVIQSFEQDCMTRRRQAGNFRNLYRMIEKLIVGTEEEKDNAA